MDRLSARFGCRTAAELIQRVTGVSIRTVNQRARLGAATRSGVGLTGEALPAQFPAVAQAMEAGVLAADAASALVQTLAPAMRVAGTGPVQAAEAAIVAGATAASPEESPLLDADDVRLQATVWRAVLDPDGVAPSEADVERRCLTLGAPQHGLVRVRGMLLPEVAAALGRYADAWTNPRTAPLPVPAAAAADAIEAPDPRTRAQRLHDVLATALMVAARAADAPSVAGNAPTLVVTVRQEDLAAGRGVAWSEGRPLGLAAARHVGCAGAVEVVVTGRGGRLLGLGSRERCFTGQQRRAIAVRDGGCVIPGCHVPVGWCEVHHVIPHATDPEGTHTDNGVLVCWFHHRTLDTSGWEVRMRDGTPEVRAPRWLDTERRWRAPARGPAC